jgi:membrane protein implicated in regulation of membrane protease activity
MWHSIFGARGQIVVGAGFLFATLAQTIYWLAITPPTVKAIFIVSMEALAFAAYAIIATGLGYRATERVEAKVADVEHADTVDSEIANVAQADTVDVG